MLTIVKFLIISICMILVAVIGYGLQAWYRHQKTKDTPPEPGQIWYEFGAMLRVTAVSPSGTVYLEDIQGSEKWFEPQLMWVKRVKERQRYLIRRVEVTNGTADPG